jgi:hypothetical protein
MGVGCEIAGRPKTLKLRAKPRKVGVRRRRDMNMGQSQPVLEALRNTFNGQRASDDFAICRDSHKSQHCRPCEPEAFDAPATISAPAGESQNRRYARERERLRWAESCVLSA